MNTVLQENLSLREAPFTSTYEPAKTEDVEVESIVEELQVVGNSSKNLEGQLSLTKAFSS